MRIQTLKATFKTAARVMTLLLFGAVASFAQQAVNLTAGSTQAVLPDGSSVPMWGYTCAGTTVIASSTATCAPLNPAAAALGNWSPVIITVPTGAAGGLQINLTNNLTFTGANIPTSLVIVGQLGGGLGAPGGFTPSPDHSNAQGATTWPIAGGAGSPIPPPTQADRVRSFGTEVAGGGGSGSLTWASLQPGTYLLESGSHPSIQVPMGLYGIVVVTTVPAGATPGLAYGTASTASAVNYGAEVPLLFSEIDPVQNNAVQTAVNTTGFDEATVWSGLPGACASTNTCYPPAVNYTPLYYLINGSGFNKTNASASLFNASPASGVTGSVLVRMVNAGLRMHVPTIVGSTTGASSAAGFSLIAEDGNPLPGVPRVQSEVFMAAGKTYDVMINTPASALSALPVFDRELSLSSNATSRDSGMLAYIGVNGAALPAAGAFAAAAANPDTYNSVVAGQTLTVSDPAKGVIANDVNIFGVKVVGASPAGLTLNPDGTFTYIAGVATSFTYCGNGATTGPACALVNLNLAPADTAGITVQNMTYTASTSTRIAINNPGVLSVDKDNAGFPLHAVTNAAPPAPQPLTGGGTYILDAAGGFSANVPGPGTYSFTYQAQNTQGITSSAATVTLIFPPPTNLTVSVKDGVTGAAVTDYRWIIEEDRTFYVNPNCTTNTTTPPVGCPSQTTTGGVPPTFGVNFHTSYMPVVATGCTGPLSCEGGQSVQGVASVCDIGDGVCRPDTTGNGWAAVDPKSVVLDPTKRYYISVLPGDAANPFNSGNTIPGHTMGGAPVAFPAANAAVTVLVEPTPLTPSRLSVFVFEDDFPLNGEQDGGGGTGNVNTNNEPGLGQFNITLFDDAGGTGDATGQMTYDMFNQPLVNSLAGTVDPTNGNDACPVSKNPRSATTAADPATLSTDPLATGITGTIVVCPEYESDNSTPSPLAGQAVVANLMPGRYGVVATPGADRIARGEEWLQTNTLDGQKAHDSFLRVGEPGFFQEYGPAGYHVAIGFANPAIINSRYQGVCNGTDPTGLIGLSCTNKVTGKVTTERMSRTPDERLYSSGSRDSFSFTQCYVSFGDPDGEDFAFTKCNADGTFELDNMPDGDWRITTFDQWNDQLVDGLSTPIRLDHTNSNSGNIGDIAANQWQANIYTSSFFDLNGNGVRDADPAGNLEPGLSLVATNIRFRDGSFSNFNNTDLSGNAGFNEIFPLFSWYVVEADTTRYKNTGTHVVYDAGGPADGTTCGAAAVPPTAPCGNSNIAQFLANTYEAVPVPGNLHVPGAVYCTTADCTGQSIKDGPNTTSTPNSTGRIDPPWVLTEGWQGFSGQNSFLEFGKTPYAACPPTCVSGTSNMGENGGIKGHVIYASTRPFDDPNLLLQTSWEPLVPNVTINLYKEGFAADNVTPTLTLVDHTTTSSWDAWAQGFRSDNIPNMNCPGQATTDMFFFSLLNQPNYLDVYNSMHGGAAVTALPNSAQFKCYDGMHNWNQLQPAPYDGYYQFPSVTSMNPTNGKPTGTNCTGCVLNPDSSDGYRFGTAMLPAGKYVVEVVVPQGYELVKEEDKNILIGDNYIAPVTQQFGGLGNIFILPDQAAIGDTYNANNPQNSTTDLGRPTLPQGEGDTGSVEQFWPCVGEARIVPDYISLFPGSFEVAPFAGATRNLCDRKEVTLENQMSALAKFYIFTSTHAAAHFTGVITDDYTSEFDPFSPQFGEKFSPPDLPISIKDFNGNEIARTYADQWGDYNGLQYSTWEVNPPNPTGYAPTMMVVCMNDPGPIPGANGSMITDPLFNPEYSQFCYEIPFMPGQTQYMDTPVVPTAGFAGAGYNNVDCAYPDATPAIAEVDGDGVGPWIANDGHTHTITITALGDQNVPNYGYSGPSATGAPFNAKTVTRHYGFGPRCNSISTSTNCKAVSSVTIAGHPMTINTWTDTQIQIRVSEGGFGNPIPSCAVQQQGQYGGSNALCGELVITAGNGRQSIDAVTVTVGGKKPTHVAASDSIQAAIDAAAPGDMIIIDPTCNTATGIAACTATGVTSKTSAAHNEMVIMWKPVRLQGVGAVTSIINANTQPAGKVNVWRQYVNCLFGLSLSGNPLSSKSVNGAPPSIYDPSGAVSCPGKGWTFFHSFDESSTTSAGLNPQVDRLPLEAVIGWSAELNGNLAEMLQEPSLMGALEGAAVTVLSKGVNFPSDPYDSTLLMGFPDGTNLLQGTTAQCFRTVRGRLTNQELNPNPFPSNFSCNPSSIDALTLTDSSQGGGAIFVHGWGHNLQIANDRITNNAGTLSGGINIGQGEYPPAYIQASATNAAPGSCLNDPTLPAGTVLPYCQNVNVNVHNNYISLNSSTGDELFSATPAGAGGVSFCTGADYYQFNYNWVCGNLTSGDGGGVGHLGFSWNGDIEHNTIIFNQSTNPTIPANGGGIMVMGTPDSDIVCNNNPTIDQDCAPAGAPGGAPGNTPVGQVGPSDGAGPNLLINANLIMGNGAEAGTGGGIAFQQVNGSDVIAFPTAPENWNTVTVTNNIITNNVAGWDGAGISLEDSLAVDVINNTVASNASTATAGVLFNTLGAPLASQQGPTCTSNCGTTSAPQPAGLVAVQNSAVLTANMQPLTITCAPGHPNCTKVSYPKLENDIFWQNSSYYVGVGGLAPGAQNQQNVVTLYNAFTTTTPPNQTATGQCVAASYWDIGVRGDTGPTNHGSTVTLAPSYSALSNITGYNGAAQHNTASSPSFLSQYCDGSRQPPEFGQTGWDVPPGISDATVPNPIFNLTPVATVDEGNNWVNLRWGPLSMVNPVTNAVLGNYGLATGSALNNAVTCGTQNYNDAPAFDFYGTPRKPAGPCQGIEPGAIELSTTVGSTGPEILSLDPNSAPVGSSNINVNLSGTGFTGVTGVSFGPGGLTGIRVNSFTVINDSSINANITIPRTATAGTHTVTLTGQPIGIPFLVTHATAGFTGPTPALTTANANRTTKTGTVTVTNTENPATDPNAGPFVLASNPAVVKNGFGGGGVFSITGGTCVAGLSVAPGSSCTIIVQYVPPAFGNNATETAHITLTGTGFNGAGGFGGFGTATSATFNGN
ncbi:MAG TPA: hypothetical protein VEU11_06710 [Terriglobales bacterium]|nr:hypothetical protein [Terriglobales bacterium]